MFLAAFCFAAYRLLFLRESRQLYDLGWFFEIAGLGALAIETMARDRQGTVEVVDLAAIQSDRLLATPA